MEIVPYFKELALGLILVLFALSFFIREKCPCKEEIAALREEIVNLKKPTSEDQ